MTVLRTLLAVLLLWVIRLRCDPFDCLGVEWWTEE